MPGFDRDGEARRAHRGEERALNHVLRVVDAYGAALVFLDNVPDVCANGLNLVVGALGARGAGFRLSVAGSLGELVGRAT